MRRGRGVRKWNGGRVAVLAAKHDRRREKRDVYVFASKNTRLSEFAH